MPGSPLPGPAGRDQPAPDSVLMAALRGVLVAGRSSWPPGCWLAGEDERAKAAPVRLPTRCAAQALMQLAPRGRSCPAAVMRRRFFLSDRVWRELVGHGWDVRSAGSDQVARLAARQLSS